MKTGDLVKIRKLNDTFVNTYFDHGIVMSIRQSKQVRLYKEYKVFNFVSQQVENIWEGALEVISKS